MDSGACWGTVHGATQSQTRLKLLSTARKTRHYIQGAHGGKPSLE